MRSKEPADGSSLPFPVILESIHLFGGKTCSRAPWIKIHWIWPSTRATASCSYPSWKRVLFPGFLDHLTFEVLWLFPTLLVQELPFRLPSTHLSSTDFNISPPYLPLQALGVTQLWSSAPLARFPRMSRRAQARSWGESQRHLVLHYLRPFNLCLRMETTWGSRDRHLISALPDLRNLCYFVPKSLNWAKWMESSFHDCTLYLTQLIPELCTQQSQQKPSLVTFT